MRESASSSGAIGVCLVAAALSSGALAGPPCTAQWDPDFGVPGANGEVRAVVSRPESGGHAVYVGGTFATIQGVMARNVAKRDASGAWSELAEGLNNFASSLAFFDDGAGGGAALYAAGSFTQAGIVAASRVAKWDGAAWSALLSGVNGTVLTMITHDDGAGAALYVGGTFNSAGGSGANRIAKWNGVGWSALGAGLTPSTGAALAMASYDDGTGPALYVAGSFTGAGGSPAANIARWKGGAWSAVAAGLNDEVDALGVHDDGGGLALFAGGKFSQSGPTSMLRIARWRAGAWTAVGGGFTEALAQVRVIAPFADGDAGEPGLYVGGAFTIAGGVAASRLARWTGSAWEAVGGGLDDTVLALAPVETADPPRLYVTGRFLNAGGSSRNRLAARIGCAPENGLPADFNGDGQVNAADLAALLGSWGPGGPPHDLTGDGFINAADLAFLLGSWHN